MRSASCSSLIGTSPCFWSETALPSHLPQRPQLCLPRPWPARSLAEEGTWSRLSAGFAGASSGQLASHARGPAPWPCCGSHCVAGGGVGTGAEPPPSFLQSAVETAELDGLGDVLGGDVASSGEVGDGARHLENAIVASRGEAEPRDGQAQELRAGVGQRAPAPGLTPAHPRVDAHVG